MALADTIRADLLAGRHIAAADYLDPAAFHGALVMLRRVPTSTGVSSRRFMLQSPKTSFRL